MGEAWFLTKCTMCSQTKSSTAVQDTALKTKYESHRFIIGLHEVMCGRSPHQFEQQGSIDRIVVQFTQSALAGMQMAKRHFREAL